MNKEQLIELIKPIKIAQVVNFEKHPNADRLLIVDVNIGDKEIKICTAANNFKLNDYVPYLGVGEIVPGFKLMQNEELRLSVRNMRGVDSHGMILAEDEIGLSDDHEGIMILNERVMENMKGKSMVEIMSDGEFEKIMKRAGIVEMTPELQNKVDLVVRDLGEVIDQERIAPILAERPLKVYWGTAPTGKPHLGYFVPILKISDLLKAGCEVTILFANIHAFLDNMKSTWELLDYRTEYYEFIIKEILNSVGVPLDKLRFIRGKEYQLKEDYTLDLYKVAALTTVQSVKGAGAEVVKQVENPTLSGMLYPILQALDEQYLGVDAQLGGMDQRKIFMFAREYLPKIGYEKRIHFMNPLIPGLGKSGKMSSSEPNSKIDLDDSDEIIKDKINKAFSIDGTVEGNGLLALLRYVLFKKIEADGRELKISRQEKWGGDVSYKNYPEVEKDFVDGKLSSVDLKPAVADELINLITPIRKKIQDNIELMNKAYP